MFILFKNMSCDCLVLTSIHFIMPMLITRLAVRSPAPTVYELDAEPQVVSPGTSQQPTTPKCLRGLKCRCQIHCLSCKNKSFSWTLIGSLPLWIVANCHKSSTAMLLQSSLWSTVFPLKKTQMTSLLRCVGAEKAVSSSEVVNRKALGRVWSYDFTAWRAVVNIKTTRVQ